MPKRPTADANDMSLMGGKKEKPSVEDELAAVRSAIMKAIVDNDFARMAALERHQTALERQQAKTAYEKAKAAHDKMKPGPEKEAAKSAMDQAHAVYLALLGACLYLGKN